ncbi:MAG: BBP7 family outer membrane beta-barrel protein [Planctomycetaceae bacterium]
MSTRLTYCLVLAAVCGLPRAVLAQAMPWNRGTRTLTQEVPASHANGPGDPLGATSYPNWNASPYASQGMWAADTVDGDAYAFGQPGHLGYPDSYGTPPNMQGPFGPGQGGVGYAPPFSPQAQFGPQRSGPQAETMYEMLPQDRGLLYDEDIAALMSAKDKLRGSWFRMEYLNWDMRNPGNTLLGAPVSGISNPRDPFIVNTVDSTGNLVQVGTARVMDMSPVDLQHMQGSRLSFGLPTSNGEFEGVFWGIQATARFRSPEFLEAQAYANRIPQFDPAFNAVTSFQRQFPLTATDNVNPNAVFVATSLMDNGQTSPLLVLYDADFSAKYNIRTWGSEANLMHDLRDPVDGWVLRSLVGFRYTSHQEELIQHGAFDNRSSLDQTQTTILINSLINGTTFPGTANILDTPLVNTIYSRTNNDYFGGQIGFKTEWANKWFAVGATPKLALGANTYSAAVETRDLRDSPSLIDPNNPGNGSVIPNPQDDGWRLTRIEKTNWSPAFDLGLHARINLTDWASLHVGYNLIWMHNIARADDVIYYNDNGLANSPGVVVQPSREDLWMKGISIGGQITLPK